MHIELNLKITINEEQRVHVYEALRAQLRQATMKFVFDAAERGGIFHRDIEIEGEAKLLEAPPVDPEPQVTYAHRDEPNGARFNQYAKDPLPCWAVDVQPL